MAENETEAAKIARLEGLLDQSNRNMEKMQASLSKLEQDRVREGEAQMSYAAIRMPAPKLEENMTLEEYQSTVETWIECGQVPKSQLGDISMRTCSSRENTEKRRD